MKGHRGDRPRPGNDRRARDPDAPVNSRRMPFDPGTVAKFADWGVRPMDGRGKVMPAVLAWLGGDPNSDDKPSSPKSKRS